jgi:DNA-binding GntR family transcriptional regulator
MKDKLPQDVLDDIFQRKLKRRNMSNDVYGKLKQMIASGKLKKGDRLVQEKLALTFDVSRQTIQTALHQLKKEGLIVWKFRAGTYVSEEM